ncbi:MAG: DnaD domain protein [Lachnospiraceae bacterium]|nr:DnaD domain protein [Lachnospiraceae bacterium]
MIPLNITSDSADGYTVLSNRFIDQYMKDANDAQIKVYLYLLRMVSANLPTDIAEIADKFNHTEKDIIRALAYWEKLHLLSIDYDCRQNITGIRLCIPSPVEPPAEPPILEVVPDKPKSVSLDYAAEKNAYTLEDIAAFQENPESNQLLFAAQQYTRRTISGPEVKTLLFIYDRLGFGLDLTDYLLQYCIGQGQKSFRAIEQTAIHWYEAGIINIKQAKSFQQAQRTALDQNTCIEIMKLLGKQGLPAKKEQEYINRWVVECAYSMELIEEACNRTVMKTDTNRFSYANSILESWHNDNIRSLKELNAAEAVRKSKNNTVRQSAYASSKKPSGSFCNIEQHDYDFAELEAVALEKAKKALTGN